MYFLNSKHLGDLEMRSQTLHFRQIIICEINIIYSHYLIALNMIVIKIVRIIIFEEGLQKGLLADWSVFNLQG